MRVLITGSRHWKDLSRIVAFMQSLPHHAVVIHGASPGGGVDSMADFAAKGCNLRVEPYPVDHELDGPWPAAGMRRNSRMVNWSRPDIAVAFRSPGKSNGTDDCIGKARRYGADCFVLLEGDPDGSQDEGLKERLAGRGPGGNQAEERVREPEADQGEGPLLLF